jgi:hypothetical protein
MLKAVELLMTGLLAGLALPVILFIALALWIRLTEPPEHDDDNGDQLMSIDGAVTKYFKC